MPRRRTKATGPEALIMPVALMLAGLYMASPDAFMGLFKTLVAIVAVFILLIVILRWGWRRVENASSGTATPKASQRAINPSRQGPRPDSVGSLPLTPSPPVATPAELREPHQWSLELLQALEWKRFEILCEAYFKAKHLDARTTAHGADGGVDIRLYEGNGERLFALVQCKAWAGRVGVKPVRELYGVMAAEGIARGIFVPSGGFTQDALAFSEGRRLRLISGEQLFKAIMKLDRQRQQALLTLATEGDYRTPTCPNCDIKLIERRGRRGAFWGCGNFPRCRYTAPMKKADREATDHLHYS